MSKENPSHQENKLIQQLSVTDALACYGIGSDDNGEYTLYKGKNQYLYAYDNGKRIAVGQEAWGEKKFIDVSTPEGKNAMVETCELKTRDELIHSLRYAKAKELAKGDLALTNIIYYAIEMNKGEDPRPSRVNGIEMYVVGGNASHDALMGVKDGRVYLFSSGDELYVLNDYHQKGEGVIEETIKDIIYKLASEWIEYMSEEERKKLLGADENEDILITKLDSENFNKLETIFEQRYGQIIRDAIEEAYKKYKKTGELTHEDNRITIEIPEFRFMVYLKPLPSDVTDKEKIYIGRGSTINVHAAEQIRDISKYN